MKKQNEMLTMVYDLYEIEVVDYIKEALIESLKDEIMDGDFCGLLLLNLMTAKRQSKARQELRLFQIKLMELVIIRLWHNL